MNSSITNVWVPVHPYILQYLVFSDLLITFLVNGRLVSKKKLEQIALII